MKRLTEKIKKHIILLTTILMLLIYIGIIITIYVFRKKNWISWEAINALVELANIFIAILIPIAAVYVEKSLEKNNKEVEEKKQEIKYSNVSLYNEVVRLQKEIENLKNNQVDMEEITKEDIDKIFADIDEDSLKEEIYNFICISMRVTTKEIMDKFKIDFSKAKSILLELSRIDGKIKIAYVDENEEDENCTWKKK